MPNPISQMLMHFEGLIQILEEHGNKFLPEQVAKMRQHVLLGENILMQEVSRINGVSLEKLEDPAED